MDTDLNSPIIIKSKLEKEDFVKAHKVIVKMKSEKSKWIIYPIVFLIVFATLIASILGADEGGRVEQNITNNQLYEVPWFIAYLPTISLLIFIVAVIFLVIFGKKAPKRHYESNKLRANLEQKKIKIANY